MHCSSFSFGATLFRLPCTLDINQEVTLETRGFLLLLISRIICVFATQRTVAWQAPRPSLSPRVCSNSRPLSRWCHPTISSSFIPFSSHLQSFPASGSFPMSQLFTSGGQIIGASASASVLPMNNQGWFPLGLIGLISWQSKGLSRVFSSTFFF